MASDADGDFAVAWVGEGQGGDGGDVYARRYNAAGVPQGGEFRVNTTTEDFQGDPAVAMDADGDFVVAWHSYYQDGSHFGIYAQRYDASGAPRGAEFLVNTFTDYGQSSPAVTSDADGDFVVAWEGGGQHLGIYARRYSAAGVAQGGEFRVTDGSSYFAAVASDSDGDFVVAWQSTGRDGDGWGVFARRYDAAGAAEGAEFRVNTITVGEQSLAAVASDSDGDFVVAWNSANQDGDGMGIYAQRYSPSGAAQGGEFRVNTTAAGEQSRPSVASDADGDFVVAWQSGGQDGSALGIYAQGYSAAGAARGAEFRVNTFTSADQSHPAVASDPEGDFVVAWRSNGQDGSGGGVYAQRYAGAPAPVRVIQVFVNGPGLTGQTSANGVAFRTLAGIDAAYGYPVPAGAGQLKSVPWIGGIDRVAVRFDQDVQAELQQADLVIHGVNSSDYAVTGFSYDPATRTGVWTLAAPVTNDRMTLVVEDAGVGGLEGDLRFGVNVLRGDATQDGRVNALDLAFVKQRLNRTAADPGSGNGAYSPFADLDGNGAVNALDLAAATQRLNSRLPAGDPTATALVFSPTAISR